ncbi:MAG: C4-type zinc ribbon domain-containing protein [Chloroflexota bacterium]|jgi:predicted  nucleic acid-binding Zn-ribbon protein
MSQVDLLYRLQQIDDEIRAGKKRLSQVIRSQRETEELLVARKLAESAAAELHEHRATQTSLNLELKSLNSKAQRSEQRLYSGTVKNPKELEDLQHELESLTRRRTTLEDELLEAMILVEEAQEEDESAQAALSEVETTWNQDQIDLKQEQDELVARINELMVLRKKHLELISPESLTQYEAALRRVGSTAVVLMKNNRCRGCLVTVPANLVKAVDEGQLVQCDSCSRILCPA